MPRSYTTCSRLTRQRSPLAPQERFAHSHASTTRIGDLRRVVLAVLLLLAPLAMLLAQNAIVTENALPGNPASEWDLPSPDDGDPTIQGFGTDLSVDQGATIDFKISVSDAAGYGIKIYRLGYYGGLGARLIADLGTFAGVAQPGPITDATGLKDYGNWSVSASWAVPANAVSGIYLAKLTRSGDGGASHIAFIVRDDDGNADLLFKTADATWQAYNGYGGNSLYTGAGPGPAGNAHKVSYNRPFRTRGGGGGSSSSEDWVFNAEYPMIRFLERNGYDVSYTTDLDQDRDPTPYTPGQHRVLLSVGHDEYWSAAARAKWEGSRNNGVHLAFFSGNEVYWKTRWENSIDGSNTPHRTLVCYKEGTAGENQCNAKCDPEATIWTGLWRSGCEFPAADGCDPENALSGQLSWVGTTLAIEVPDTYKDLRFWRNTGVASLGAGQTKTFPNGTLGYEWDHEQAAYEASYPRGRILLSSTTQNGKTHRLALYRHSSGALVFGAGTVQWSWGLDAVHDGNAAPVDPDMQQATINLLADMGVQAQTLQGGLVAATASTDGTAPTSVIGAPAHAATFPNNSMVPLSGTASDAGGGVVAGVEVSVDGGSTWRVATGTTTWTYDWVPNAEGTYAIQSRAFDDSGNMEVPGTAPTTNAISVTIEGALPCPCTLFMPSDTPDSPNENDGNALEVGMKFSTTEDGYITALRFYKGAGNGGTHTGDLWSAAGDLLGSAVFTNETASGWQEVALSPPVPVLQATTYVVSYHSSGGGYAVTDPYFQVARINGPLRGLANGEDGPNGVYLYSPTPAFPTDNFQSSNYWVDVVFEESVGPDVSAPVISAQSPAPGATGVAISTTITATFNEAIDQGTLSAATFYLEDSGNNAVAATMSYASGTRTATLDPNATLDPSTTYTARLVGGGSGITDLAGNPLAADVIWSFTTGAAPPPPPPLPTDGPGGPVLLISSSVNPFSRYPVEILRAEGFNNFDALDAQAVDATVLDAHDVVILGDMPASAGLVALMETWVDAGGTLIVLRPEAGNTALQALLGLAPAGGSTAEGYLLIDTSTPHGTGLVNETIQFHGSADHYTLSGGATALATLYSDASTATAYPAVTTRSVGTNGGSASAFTYDLARSVVHTRQGNPAWAGQERDGQSGPKRANDMFYGNAAFDPQPDWNDMSKVAIPQADEQQHLLSNLITLGSLHRAPMPRFWFLPNKHKAAIVMTGDDHAAGGTDDRFDQYMALSADNSAQAVADWTAIRSSSYIFPNTPISDAQVAAYQDAGFEIGIHLNTACSDFTPATYDSELSGQLALLHSNFPSILPTTTHRTHCIAWSDWSSEAEREAAAGIRLDVNYYYWPGAWVQDRPGMFTGSGMPMRFAQLDGSLIDCYQVVTQMTDESDISYGPFCDALLNKAQGPEGYYGVFCANMHTDANTPTYAGSDAIIASAQAHNVPVISAKQMLTWLDGRNASTYDNISWSGTALSFTAAVGAGAHNLYGMVPVNTLNGALTSISNGVNVAYTVETIKGIAYAFFPVTNGTYTASYDVDSSAPVISNVLATPANDGTATITWDTDEAADSRVDHGLKHDPLALSTYYATLVTAHQVQLTGLQADTTYYFRVVSADAALNSASGPAAPDSIAFTMPPPNCFSDANAADFAQGSFAATTLALADDAVTLQPAIAEEFTALPPASAWASYPWTGGTSTVTSGVLSVDGARYNTDASAASGPGSAMEMVVTFGAGSFQHAGFGGGTDAIGSGGIYNGENNWAMFSTHNTGGGQVYARTKSGGTTADLALGAAYIGTAHRYRIEWNAGNVLFYIDGGLVHTETVAITGTMRPAISDYTFGGPLVQVDWIRVTPYQSSGTFTSRVYDAGTVTAWNTLNYTANTPSGTTLALSVRSGGTAVPDGSWSAFAPLANGAAVGASARYIQYRASFTSTDPQHSAVLEQVSIACAAAPDAPPVVSLQPLSWSDCESMTAEFIAHASGLPLPTVLWEQSTDGGTTWTPVPDATSDTLAVLATAGDDGTAYRAIFTNSEGADTTATATLSVNALPAATLTAADASPCPGQAIELRLDASSGQGPFDIVVDGHLYTNVSSGVPFAISEPTRIWSNTGPSPQLIDDNDQIVLGVKFRSTEAGTISAIRFFKGWNDTGTLNYTVRLWTDGTQAVPGVILGEATASLGDGDTGWQEIPFAAPIAIQANTTYIASFLTPEGNYVYSGAYFASAYNEPGSPLSALSNTDGPNGVFAYLGGTPGFPFPSASFNAANYWVDVVFDRSTGSAVHELTLITDLHSCITTGAPLDTAAVIVAPVPDGTLSGVSMACSNDDIALTFTASAGTGPYDLVVNGTAYTGVASGSTFASGIAGTAQSHTVWPAASIGGSQNVDPTATELGMRFSAAASGSITAIRVYKTGTNTPDLTGSIWTDGGVLLATTPTYTADAAPGWKEIALLSPVAITANTPYRVSYASPSGNYYAFTANGLSAPIVAPPLTASASFYLQPGTGFPNTASTANYWVDVVFNTGSNMDFTLTTIGDANGCSASAPSLGTCSVPIQSGTTYYSREVGNAVQDLWSTSPLGLPGYASWNTCASMVVQPGHTITVSADMGVKNIEVQAGGTLVLADGATFSAWGTSADLFGTLTAEANSTLELTNGTSPVTISTTGTPSLHDLRIATPAGTTVSGNLDIRGTLQLDQGAFNATAANLTLRSTISGTGRLGPIQSGASYIGNLKIERYIPGGATNWRLLGSALENRTVVNWQDDFITAGYPGSQYPNFFDPPGSGNFWPSIRWYDETNTGTQAGDGLIGVSSSAQPLASGQGFAVWCGDNLGGTAPFVVDLGGTAPRIATTPIALPMSWTDTGTPEVDGWNLVSNPLPSPIAFAAIARGADVEDYVTFYDPANGNTSVYDISLGYGTNGATNTIQSSQGFYLKAAGPNVGTTVEESDKIEDNGGGIFGDVVPPALLRMAISSSINQFSDESLVVFHVGAPELEDEDVLKYVLAHPAAPQLASLAPNGTPLAINAYGTHEAGISIPLSVNAAVTGTYTLTLTEVSELDLSCVALHDLLTGTITPLVGTTTYNFTVNANADPAVARLLLRTTAPMASFTAPATLAPGEVLTPTNTSVDAVSYLWNFGDGTTSTAAQPSHTYAIGGSYEVSLTATTGDCSSIALRTVVANSASLPLSAKVMLQGPYDAETGLMRDDLRVAGLVPLSEPYSALAYPFVGGGGESTDAAVLAVAGSNAIVDWVLVELRDSNDAGHVLESRCGLLQRDGDVVGMNGVSPLAFGQTAGDYFVAIRHRNHLAVMSRSAIAMGTSGTVLDMRTAPAYGTDARALITGSTPTEALWAGDATFDGVLKYTGGTNDRDPILQTIGGSVATNTENGYFQGDVNMDGTAKYTGASNDRDIILQNIGGVVPTNIREEQLP